MSARVDLDAARAARREVEGEAPIVVLGGEEFTFPVELPFSIVGDIGKLFDVRDDQEALADLTVEVMPVIIQTLLGPDHARFMAHRPSVDDLIAMLDGVMEAYGLSDVGESSASA